jgi:hypothetical protein
MIGINSFPKIPYQELARAIRDLKVEDRMIPEMFKLRQFENYTEKELNMQDINKILEYIKVAYPIDDYPEKWI